MTREYDRIRFDLLISPEDQIAWVEDQLTKLKDRTYQPKMSAKVRLHLTRKLMQELAYLMPTREPR
jgi:hypothetical protein